MVEGGWEIGGRKWAENPRVVLPAEIFAVVDLWLLGRRFAGMAGRPLPCGGAVGDQPAALMDAFEILDRLVEQKDG